MRLALVGARSQLVDGERLDDPLGDVVDGNAARRPREEGAVVGVTVEDDVRAQLVDRPAEARGAEEGEQLGRLANERIGDRRVVQDDDAPLGVETSQRIAETERLAQADFDERLQRLLAKGRDEVSAEPAAEALRSGEADALAGELEHDASAVEDVDAGLAEDLGDHRLLVELVVVVAEDGDDRHANTAQLVDEGARLSRLPNRRQIARQHERVGSLVHFPQRGGNSAGRLFVTVDVAHGRDAYSRQRSLPRSRDQTRHTRRSLTQSASLGPDAAAIASTVSHPPPPSAIIQQRQSPARRRPVTLGGKMRRTKIVCTIGPATNSREGIEGLIRAGMNVARLNFSHGSHEEHGRVIDLIREISRDLGVNIAILQDLQGPKIRIGSLAPKTLRLQTGSRLTITTEPVVGSVEQLSTTYKLLPDDVHPGDRILMADGLVELRVDSIVDRVVGATVVRGGLVSERSGLNLPGVSVSATSLTEKDVADLRYGVSRDVDYIAISFVRRAADVLDAKRLIQDLGSDIPIIAKLEKPEAIANLDEILAVADAVMVARGDLGVEVSVEKVPLLQKTILARANERGLPAITATQMLESMVHNQTPTRAEASDVANAILDGTDAVMLSAETAIGDFPITVVETMARIATETEAAPDALRCNIPAPAPSEPEDFPQAIAKAATLVARDVNAAAIIAFTRTGSTARLVSKRRPTVPIVAVTTTDRIARRMALYSDVYPGVVQRPAGLDELLDVVTSGARSLKIVKPGDTVVITSSTGSAPLTAATNLLELRRL